MGLIIQRDDFVGDYELTISMGDNIDAFIDKYEPIYLIDLLGKPMYDLFKDGVENYVPVNPIYKALYDPFAFTYGCERVSSFGLKYTLLGFIFFEYCRKNIIKQKVSGSSSQQSEVSTPVSLNFLYISYNQSVDAYNAIQRFILEDKEGNYPTFSGVRKVISWVV